MGKKCTINGVLDALKDEVPKRIDKIKEEGHPSQSDADIASKVLSDSGFLLMRGDRKLDEMVAELSVALAVLSFSPSGVKYYSLFFKS